ncbi:proteasome assembly chaperone family protein [Salarchaeum sp. JOR-1]|uniref:proteasome assembly chaperone family protein n=1 Tax=Salarchaeum sp. JOR-1 TaxID=2599399 RepID=UPI001198B877|nr:proteasome assembly chaperone family protein [Salarchaeum sp. JOR-1]QDX41467.1 proteasome assembly chaperone family protein [Salarchaeum sp. JOR-1]
MARVREKTDVSLDDPMLVEGLPGVGLVGKIATDLLVDQFDMEYVASIDADGIPRVAIYDEGNRGIEPPVRIYADEERDLLALQSDVPVSRTAAVDFADSVTNWLTDVDATPIYLSGLPVEDQTANAIPDIYGVATGNAATLLDENDIATPPERGVVGGPTGALLNRAGETHLDAVGLVVESDPQFPDPAAADQLLTNGIEPITGVDADTDELVDRAEEIREQKEKLAQRMQQASEEESSQAQPMRMFQ